MRQITIYKLLIIILLVISEGCKTTPQLRPEPQVNNIYFEIQGLSKPAHHIEQPEVRLKIDAEVTIAAIGDIIPHQNVKKAASMHNILNDNGISQNNEGYDYLYERVSELLKSDITIANYESPLAPSTGSGSRPFIFNSDLHFLRAARTANINVFNIANNHIYDQDLNGFLETLKNFNDEKIKYIGIYNKYNNKPIPLVIEEKGIKICIFGFTTLLNNIPNYQSVNEYVRKFDNEIDTKAIQEAKSKYDIVIVYIHWGDEYQKEPNSLQREIAENLINHGADIIIGSHPHILQPLELTVSKDGRVVPIAFSMGNFISNQSRNYYFPISGADEGRTRDSAILRFKVTKYSFGDISFCTISDLHFIPLWTHNNTLFYSRGIDKKLEIYVFPIINRISELRKIIEEEKEETRKKEFLMELENLLFRLKIIKSTIGEDFVR